MDLSPVAIREASKIYPPPPRRVCLVLCCVRNLPFQGRLHGFDSRTRCVNICSRDGCSTQTGNPKYCSRSCSAIVNNSKFVKRTRETLVCLECGEKLKHTQKKFCSQEHAGRYRRKSSYEAWVRGELSASTENDGLKVWARNYLLDLSGNACSACGWCVPNPVVGRPILTVNHIDGNWKNNSFENLEVLCYNCHTLTPTFGSLNAGSPSGRRPYAFDR